MSASSTTEQHIMKELPEIGFLRLEQIIGNPKANKAGVLPISRSAWYAGIKEGRFPKPVTMGPRLSLWRVSDIRKLVTELGAT